MINIRIQQTHRNPNLRDSQRFPDWRGLVLKNSSTESSESSLSSGAYVISSYSSFGTLLRSKAG
jgi:hypothetical protein